MAMNVDFYDVIAKDGQTPAERFAGMTKDADSFYTVGSDLYLGEIKLSNAADLSVAVANIAQNAADIATINTTLTKLENTEETAGSIRAIIKSYLEGLDVAEFAVAEVGTGADANKVSIYGVKEVDGKIEKGANAVQLAAVAKTGASADVAYDNTTSGLTATDVKAAIDEVASASAGGVNSKTIWLNDAETVTAGYLKTYGIYQGANSFDAETNPATLIGKIDIPKDLVVTAGKVVTVTSGTDSDGETTTVADGTYVKLTIANQTEKIYINVHDLVDVYTPQQNATQIQLAISATNEISATVVAGSITATELAANAVTTVKIVDGNVTKAKLAQSVQDSLDLADSAVQSITEGATDGTISVDGTDVNVHGLSDVAISGAAGDVSYDNTNSQLIATTLQGAIDELDEAIDNIDVSGDIDDAIATLTGSAGIASKSGDVVTLKAGVVEANGKISNSSDADIALAAVASTGAAADVAVADVGNNFTTDNVEAALSEIASHLTWKEV